MHFEIVRNDITNMHVGAITNTTNPKSIIDYAADACFNKENRHPLPMQQEICDIARGSTSVIPTCNLELECHEF